MTFLDFPSSVSSTHPSSYSPAASASSASATSFPSSPLVHCTSEQPKVNSPRESGMLGALFGRGDRSRSTSTVGPDVSERQRLETLHSIQTTLLSPQYSSIIHNHLALIHRTGRRSKVLDVGTGTAGTWAISLAQSEPFADVLAVDIDWSNFAGGTTTPGNVEFNTVDVRNPLPWPSGSFDLIHVKSLLLDIPNYPVLMERSAVILRPKGMLVIVEGEPQFHTVIGQPPHTVRTWNACVKDAFLARCIDVELPRNLLAYLGTVGVFEPAAFTQEVGMPCAGFMRGSSQTLARTGRQHQSVIAASINHMIPVLLDHNYSADEVHGVANSTIAELSNPTSRYYQRLFAVYATKRSF